jgi:hypothetical protein
MDLQHSNRGRPRDAKEIIRINQEQDQEGQPLDVSTGR